MSKSDIKSELVGQLSRLETERQSVVKQIEILGALNLPTLPITKIHPHSAWADFVVLAEMFGSSFSEAFELLSELDTVPCVIVRGGCTSIYPEGHSKAKGDSKAAVGGVHAEVLHDSVRGKDIITLHCYTRQVGVLLEIRVHV